MTGSSPRPSPRPVRPLGAHTQAGGALLDALDAEIADSDHARPVLIGGVARSGTTMLGALLGSGPAALTVPEARFKWGVLSHEADGVVDLPRVVDHLRADWKFPLWSVPLPPDVPARRVGYAALLNALVRVHAAGLGAAPPPVWIDHTPGNLHFAASLSRVLPQARFVHVVRDGRAVAASMLPLDWGPNDVSSLAEMWAARIGISLGAVALLGPERACTVRYEDLVLKPAETLGRLRAFLELPADEDATGADEVHPTPAGRQYAVHAYTARQHDLVTRPPDPSRVDAWRRRLPPRHVEAFESATGELLAYLGYELDYGVRARPLPSLRRLTESSVGTARRITWDRVRRRLRRRTLEGEA